MPRPVPDLLEFAVPAGPALEAAAGALEVDAAAGRRTIAGVAVPWGEVGVTSWGPTRFERGAIDAAGRPPALRDHDRTRPVGVVAEATDDGRALRAVIRASATSLGDETLTLAGDGALPGLSVGVRPVEYRFERDATYGEVLVVTAAEWRELSVLTFQAFPSARIDHVAAGEPQQEDAPAMTDTLTPPAPAPVVTAGEPPAPTPGTPTVAPTTAPATTRPRLPRLNAGQVAHLMLRAERGDTRAAEVMRDLIAGEPAGVLDLFAAGETTTTNPGLIPPSYSSDIIGGLPVATPFTDLLCRRTGLPAAGMSLVKPKWTAVPDGDWVTAENAAAPTSAATIGTQPVSVLQYAHAVQASIALIERGDFGGYASAYYAQVGIDYRSKKETKLVTTAVAAADAVTVTAGDTPEQVIGACVAHAIAAQKDADGNFRGLMPEYAAVGADVWADLATRKALEGITAYGNGSVEFGSLRGSLSGLVVALIPNIAAKQVMVGARAATVLHDGSDAQLRALVVNTLSVELGVTGFCAVDIEYADALAKATWTPAAPAARK